MSRWPLYTRQDEASARGDTVWSPLTVLDAPPGRTNEPWAWATDLNPLDPQFDAALRRIQSEMPKRVVLPTGWLAAGPLERSARTWGSEGVAALDQACKRICPWAEGRQVRVLLRPHCRHVLSDVQRSVAFLREHAGSAIGLMLDPCALLEESMLAQAEDHLRLALVHLGPLAEGVWLAGVRFAPGGLPEDPASPVPTPLDEGDVPAALLLQLVRAHIPSGMPIVLEPGGVLRQAAILSAAE